MLFQSSDLCQWVAHIQRQHWRTMDMTLDRVSEVWARLQQEITGFKVVIAGTNGKGSTVAMLESVALHSGNTTGAYTSPHLLRFNERIRINGVAAEDHEICAAFSKIEAARENIPLTYFEYGTLCALLLFAKHNVDLCLMEIGLGGRLDAVNMIDNDLSIITQVGIDHCAWLGNDRETIAREKSGVIRPRTVVVCSDPDTPTAVIETAQHQRANLLALNRDFSFKVEDDITWIGDHPLIAPEWRTIKALRIPLAGAHQLNNLSGVVAAASQFPATLRISPKSLTTGLYQVQLAGRCQMVAENPRIILDVAHNPDSARELSKFLQSTPVNGRTFGVFAALADKDVDGIVAPLLPYIDRWYLAGLEQERGQSADQLVANPQLTLRGNKFELFATPVLAWETAKKQAKTVDRIVIFGSFHTVGDILAILSSSVNRSSTIKTPLD